MTSPLDDNDLAELNLSLEALDKADEIIKRAKQAGIDIKAQEEASKDTRMKLSGIKGAFFPGR